MQERVTSIDLLGHVYPLCLTVEAQGEIQQLCGGIDKVSALFETEDVTKLMDNIVKLLNIFLKGGVSRARVLDKLDGTSTAQGLVLFTCDELRSAISVADLVVCQRAILEALSAGTSVTVEVEPERETGKKQNATP